MKLKTITVKGQQFDVEVDQAGKFGTNYPNKRFYSFASLQELEQDLTKELSKPTFKASIPFARWKDGKLLKGVGTGIHGRTSNVLVKWEDGSTSQEDSWSYHGSDFLRFPTPEEEAQFVHVCQEAASFEAQRRALYDKYKFDLRKELQAHLDKMVREPKS